MTVGNNRRTVIPAGAAGLFPARGVCAPGFEVEGPWLDLCVH